MIAYDSPGVGTSLHITMEQTAERQGIDWLHVPFRGMAENLQALLGGQTQAAAYSSGWAQLAEDGRLRLLVVWSAERAKRSRACRRRARSASTWSPPRRTASPGRRAWPRSSVRILDDAIRDAVLDRYDMLPA